MTSHENPLQSVAQRGTQSYAHDFALPNGFLFLQRGIEENNKTRYYFRFTSLHNLNFHPIVCVGANKKNRLPLNVKSFVPQLNPSLLAKPNNGIQRRNLDGNDVWYHCTSCKVGFLNFSTKVNDSSIHYLLIITKFQERF